MTTKYQLKNGMNVLLVESRKSPVVSVQMWVKTGSADEKKGIEGISHFIEHLVFKGSEKFGVGEMAQTIEGSGGVLNAYTSFDQTVFYVTVSSQFVDSGIEVISEMIGRPKFDANEIDNEREVVIEEIKRSIDSPHQQASRLLFSTLYRKHPYRVPVIGYDDNIRRVPRKKIVGYYNSRYVPQNMNLVIVGDFKTTDMKKRVARHFESFSKHKLMKVRRSPEPARKAPAVRTQKGQFQESFLHICFDVPNARHRDSVPLMALSAILGQGDSSRLVHELRNTKNLVTSIGASVFSPKEPGFLALSATLDHKNLETAVEHVTKVVGEMIAYGPTDDEVRKAIKQMESEKFYSMETVDGQAGLYGHFEFLFSDYKQFDRILKETSKLTAADIQRVARKYINPRTVVASYLAPEDEALTKNALKTWQKNFEAIVCQARQEPALKRKPVRGAGIKWSPPKREVSSAPERIVLPNGIRLVGRQIVGSPVTSMRVGLLGGLRFEPTADIGLNELLSRVWVSGTQKLSEHELNIEIENMASSLSGFGGRNSFGLSSTTLKPFFPRVVEILSEVLIDPRLPDDAIAREKIMMKEQIKTRNDKPAQTCMLALMRLLFEGHPYSRDPLGEVETVDALSREKVANFLNKLRLSHNLVVSIAGDVNLGKFAKKLEQSWASLPAQNLPENRLRTPGVGADQHVFSFLDREQSHIALAYPGLTFRDPRRYDLEVLQAILSGQGGRLFIELRDKASLAYTVTPIRMDGMEHGYFGAYIGCSPEKGDLAVKMMLEQFSRLVEEPVSDGELQRAKRYLLGRHDIGRQRTGNIADSFLFDELYGLEFDESEKFSERLGSVTSGSIQAVARAIFSQHYSLSVVGRKDVSI